MNESTLECVYVCESGCVYMLDVLGSESGTVQVRTSNSWMRREDEKNIKGIRRLNLNSSALLWHSRPPAV